MRPRAPRTVKNTLDRCKGRDNCFLTQTIPKNGNLFSLSCLAAMRQTLQAMADKTTTASGTCPHFVRRVPLGDTTERDVCGQCGHIHYSNPKIVVGAVVMHGEHILLCRRCLLYTSPSPRDRQKSRMPSSA